MQRRKKLPLPMFAFACNAFSLCKSKFWMYMYEAHGAYKSMKHTSVIFLRQMPEHTMLFNICLSVASTAKTFRNDYMMHARP